MDVTKTQQKKISQGSVFGGFYKTVDLGKILRELMRNKIVSLIILLLAICLSVFYSLQLPNIYKSEVTLLPVTSENQGQLGKLSSQFGGIASLAGISLAGNNSTDKVTVALEIMKSRQFLQNFIKEYDLIPLIMAVESWDLRADKPVYDTSLYDKDTKKWTRVVNFPRRAEPSLLETSEKLREIFAVNYDNESGVVTASLEYYSPKLAKAWLELMIREINDTMRESERLESQESLEFLNAQLATTEVNETRTLLYSMIQEQLQNLMFTEIRAEYVFKTIDPPYLPEIKVRPARALIVLIGALIGGLGILLFLLLKIFLSDRNT